MKVMNRCDKKEFELSDDYKKVITTCNNMERCNKCIYYINESCRGFIESDGTYFYPFELDIMKQEG